MTSSTGCSGLTFLRIAPEPQDAVAHRRQIDDRRHAGEVLQQDAGRRERDLLLNLRRHVPAGEGLDVLRVDEPGIFAAQQVLEQDLERERQTPDRREAGLLERPQAEDVKGLSADGQRSPCAERIVGAHPLIILHSGVCVQGANVTTDNTEPRSPSPAPRQERADHIRRVAAIGVDGTVHLAHIRDRHPSGERTRGRRGPRDAPAASRSARRRRRRRAENSGGCPRA